MSRNAVSITYDDGSIQNLGPVVAPTPVPAPSLPISSILKGGYFDGVPDNQAAAVAAQFGMTAVRSWFTIQDWTKPPQSSDFARQRTLKAAGLTNLVVFTPPEVTGMPAPTPAIAAAWFQGAAAASVGCVDYYEIFNEANLSQYNADYAQHASSWLTNALQPAYQVLRAAGQTVVSGGWSGGPNNGFAYALQKGLLNFCDYVGFHPYGSNAADQLSRVQQMRQLIGNKPLILSEWNLHMNANDPTTWMSELNTAAQDIKGLVQGIFHFKLIQNTSAAGVAAPFDSTGQSRNIWYSGTVAAMNNF